MHHKENVIANYDDIGRYDVIDMIAALHSVFVKSHTLNTAYYFIASNADTASTGGVPESCAPESLEAAADDLEAKLKLLETKINETTLFSDLVRKICGCGLEFHDLKQSL